MDTWKFLSQIFVCYCVGFSFLISLGRGSLPFEERLCHIQCHLFCKNQSLEPQNGICDACSSLQKQHWIFNCSRPAECSGTCNMFRYLPAGELVPETPKLESNLSSISAIQLKWLGSSNSNEVTYLIQKKENGKWIEERQLQNNSMEIADLDVCTVHKYRVIAINKYGSSGASEKLIIDKPKIGKVTDVHLAQNWRFDNLTSEFKAVIQCGIPRGWRESNIDGCVFEVSEKSCPQQFNSPEQFSVYFDLKNKTRTQVRIISKAFSCSYLIKTNAVSRCKEQGESFYYKLNLTECSSIRDFVCPTEHINPPGVVENVRIHVSYDGNVDIGWKPPSDLGTVGVVNSYGIRWGQAELETDMMDFITLGTDAAHVWTVQQNFTRISLKRYKPHKIYGIQIIALYPGQSFGADEWDLFSVYPFCYKGEADLNIDSESNSCQVNVSWVTGGLSEKSCSNLKRAEMYERYAVRWGPADSTDVQSMTITSLEGTAIFSVNTSLLFNITQPGVPYGMMVIPVKSKGYLPTDDDDWKNASSYSFIVQSERRTQTENGTNWGVLATGLSIAVSVMVLIGAFIYRRKQKSLTRLDIVPSVSSNIYYSQPVERYLPHSQMIGSIDSEERSWEVPYQNIRFQNELGRGAFGKVFRAEINSCWLLRNKGQGPPKRLTVAVKMLHDSAEEIFQMDFIREIQVMKKIGYHENIVSMLGCCTGKSPIYLIVEHFPLGDLLSYLRSQRQKIKNVNRGEDNPLHYVNCSDVLTSSKLLLMAKQIACGMEYLSSKGFVHRDLAARNVLVGENLTTKIGDFGLTRYIYNDKVYVNLKGGKLPIKWMSIEAIFDRTFSTASDVWSFGILLYEIISLGGVPYPTLDASNLLGELEKGYRMSEPDNCSHQLYDLMQACWRTMPEERPTFKELIRQLETLGAGEEVGQRHISLRSVFRTTGHRENLANAVGEGRRDIEANTKQNHRISKLPSLSRSFSSPPTSLPHSPPFSASLPLSAPYSLAPLSLSPPPSTSPSSSSSQLFFSTPHSPSTPLSFCPPTYPPLCPNTPFHSASSSFLGDDEEEEEEEVFVAGETQCDQLFFPRKGNGFVNPSYDGVILKPVNLDRKSVGSNLSTSSTSKLMGSEHE